MTKKLAFTSEFGNELVSAEKVRWLRNTYFNGEPTGKPYFSTHHPGRRKRVKHIMKGSCFFAYVEGGGNKEASDGESLNHLLFKKALASLTHVKLSLFRPTSVGPKHWRDAHIRIKHAETEKSIKRTDDTALYADVYIEFEDTHHAAIGVKWEGRLYLEVRHTHAVDAAKLVALRSLELPVIELEIPKIFAYRVPDDETTDELQEAHCQRIKALLENGDQVLKGNVLSNPSSKPYLQQLSRHLSKSVKDLTESNAALTQQLSKASSSLQVLTSENDRLTAQIDHHRQEVARGVALLKKSDRDREDLDSVASRLREHRLWLVATNALLAAGIVLAFFM